LAGFTGAHLKPLLEAEGYEVFGTAEPPEFDLRSAASVDDAVRACKPDYVVHLAGISFVPYSDALDFYATNVVGATHLLEAIERNAGGVRKILLASSANVYGNCDRYLIDEDVSPAPVNHYGCSKLSMEFMARTWFDRLPIVAVRLFNYTGPRQSDRFIIPKLVKHFAAKAPVISLGNIDVVRDFSDVRMVCDAYCRLLSAPVRSATLNVCSGIGRSLRELLAELTRLSGYSPEISVDPTLLRAAEVMRLVGSNAALQRAIGPMRYLDFDATLRWMYGEAASSLPAS
jgi:nucleoside-diphosphate-sugar epimerase